MSNLVASHGFDDNQDDDNFGFVPLEIMPTSRLNDVSNALEEGHPSVINLDACIPRGNFSVFQTLLFKINKANSVKTLSLRFNAFNEVETVMLIDWIGHNNTLETLYILGSGIEGVRRTSLETAWKRNLRGHRTENMGCTFIRIPKPMETS